jgi:hypothetical protein
VRCPVLETAHSLLPKSSGSRSPEWWRRECAGEAGRSQRNRPPAGFGLAAEIGARNVPRPQIEKQAPDVPVSCAKLCYLWLISKLGQTVWLIGPRQPVQLVTRSQSNGSLCDSQRVL